MYKAPTVTKAFQILRMICRTNGGMTLSELSKGLGIGKSSVLGIAVALEELGAVTRAADTRRYRLGPTLFELGRAAFSRIDVKDVARPFMEELMRKTRESVFLGVRNHDHVTILETVESVQDLKITSPVGTMIPLLAGAIGKVFLSVVDDREAAALLKERGLPRYTENSIVDPALYLEQVSDAGRNAYAIDDEEYISGVRAVAAPIRNADQLLAAIWVVGFKPSLNDAKMNAVIGDIRETAAAISSRIERDALEPPLP
jgi:IclR family KDG regulon transcriptional repressor